MNRHVLADRIVVYCDTVVAFPVVNGFAFLIALGEPDIRCSIAEIGWMIGGIYAATFDTTCAASLR